MGRSTRGALTNGTKRPAQIRQIDQIMERHITAIMSNKALSLKQIKAPLRPFKDIIKLTSWKGLDLSL
jgi:hypothetical protein